ncbi:hypothetical protein AMAG_20678 [Allomyces macrogynus ATCC 38327]|uniref:Uncharacterized protein n=1 Tax=Allomyces macrogynus (strain ATCC 38327) TaxID=578462 RepID=A0A0L0TEF7_ALLM3|nr:hypothetical protein AMAG_20678 [Allomyces macrogynus ATCC 38327]|eukprot:KNE73137.1 hypothetical protein AMAG_20678 [Allomyces macrogynus ATCC 38327]
MCLVLHEGEDDFRQCFEINCAGTLPVAGPRFSGVRIDLLKLDALPEQRRRVLTSSPFWPATLAWLHATIAPGAVSHIVHLNLARKGCRCYGKWEMPTDRSRRASASNSASSSADGTPAPPPPPTDATGNANTNATGSSNSANNNKRKRPTADDPVTIYVHVENRSKALVVTPDMLVSFEVFLAAVLPRLRSGFTVGTVPWFTYTTPIDGISVAQARKGGKVRVHVVDNDPSFRFPATHADAAGSAAAAARALLPLPGAPPPTATPPETEILVHQMQADGGAMHLLGAIGVPPMALISEVLELIKDELLGDRSLTVTAMGRLKDGMPIPVPPGQWQKYPVARWWGKGEQMYVVL